MNFMKRYFYLFIIATAILICWFSWPVVSLFTSKEIQPIASAISTFSGILFGFIMASLSLFASAKENTLIRNTQLTGHLPKLVSRLHLTMGLLLGVCFTFLLVLFLPDNLEFIVKGGAYKYSVAVVTFGIFLLINAFVQFYFSWRGFKDISSHM